jgi:hypothetical protein
MGEHLMGRGHSGAQCASGDQKRGYGEKWGEHTHNHTLLRPGSSEKDAQGPPSGTQRGARTSGTQLDAHRHWEGGTRCLRQFSAQRQTPGSPLGSLEAGMSPFSRLVGDGPGRGGRGPHSTLQQLMQPFWEP